MLFFAYKAGLFRTKSIIKDKASCKSNQQLWVINYFCKKYHLRCLTGFWIRLWCNHYIFDEMWKIYHHSYHWSNCPRVVTFISVSSFFLPMFCSSFTYFLQWGTKYFTIKPQIKYWKLSLFSTINFKMSVFLQMKNSLQTSKKGTNFRGTPCFDKFNHPGNLLYSSFMRV